MTYKVNITGTSMPRLVDYRCDSCNAFYEDVYYNSREAVEKEISCSCGHKAHEVWSSRSNFIHPSHSGMYGKPQPAFGNIVMEDYGHKQRLLREFGVQESNDAIGGSKKRSEEAWHKHHLAEKEKPREATTWVDAPKGEM
jgi:hypothetical protein